MFFDAPTKIHFKLKKILLEILIKNGIKVTHFRTLIFLDSTRVKSLIKIFNIIINLEEFNFKDIKSKSVDNLAFHNNFLPDLKINDNNLE